MQRITIATLTFVFAIGLFALATYKLTTNNTVQAQSNEQAQTRHEESRRSRCSKRTAAAHTAIR